MVPNMEERRVEMDLKMLTIIGIPITQISIEVGLLDHQLKNRNCLVLYIIVLKGLYFRLHDQTIQLCFLVD